MKEWTIAEIARQFGRSEPWVLEKAKSLGNKFGRRGENRKLLINEEGFERLKQIHLASPLHGRYFRPSTAPPPIPAT